MNFRLIFRKTHGLYLLNHLAQGSQLGCMCVCVCVYVYIYTEREREIDFFFPSWPVLCFMLIQKSYSQRNANNICLNTINLSVAADGGNDAHVVKITTYRNTYLARSRMRSLQK